MQCGMKGQDSARRGETLLVVFEVFRLPCNKTVRIFRTQTRPESSVMDPTRSHILQALKCTSSGLLLPQGEKWALGKCIYPLLTWLTQCSIMDLWANTGLRKSLLPTIVLFPVCVCIYTHACDNRQVTMHCCPINVELCKKKPQTSLNSALAGESPLTSILLVLTRSILFLYPPRISAHPREATP